ncbi:ETS homologous factor [Armadillidium nasatum]|uniref:ETS homologous factor n=1 Tax=Armadillidium nasatum TaxID=96803 RepID=A0A5N5SW10_9CRUS|nr:ETS homologous factor [Armadillidium nasatum]
MVDLENEFNSPTVYGNCNDLFDSFTLTDDSCFQGPQNLDYIQGQRNSQLPQDTESQGHHQRPHHHHHQNCLGNDWNEMNVMNDGLKNDFLNTSFDTLDDLDPECLFYKKSFTELTPMKCDANDMSSLSWASPDMKCDASDMSSWASPDSVLSKSFSNPDLVVGLENFQEISPSQEFSEFNQRNFSEEWILQELLNNDSCQELENEVVANEYLNDQYCQDSQMRICQNDFEKIFQKTLPNLSNKKNDIYDKPNFNNIFGYLDAENNQSSNQDSFDDYKKENSQIMGERSWVKEIKASKTSRPRGPKCWEFLLRLLKDSASNPSLVKWENPEIGSFKLVEKDKISAIWGNRPSKKKNGKVIKYESFARILRYHYKKGSGMVLPVSEKHLVYKFASKVMAAYRAGKIL